MTPIFFLEQLVKYVTILTKNYKCPTADDNEKDIAVYAQELPVKTDSVQKYCPFILCRITGGEDTAGKSSIVRIRIIFGTVDKDIEQSWLTLLNALNHIRQELLKNRGVKIGADYYGRLLLPMKYQVEAPQPYPLGYGFIDTEWEIPQLVEEEKYFEKR